ncbi:MAG TPA: response regulator [Candidatus Acidoferrales bacterium]|nr:response regulator [Candidatus Acidoferrales bacterium]
MPTILIADDNSNIQKMVSLALKGEGIEVVAVGNGEAAVRKLREISPDVVLADTFMPVRNGYEVCDFVKHEPRLAHVPVILLTGAFDPFDEQEAQRVGADGVLKKPFVPPDPLVSLVKSLIARGSAEQLVGVAAETKSSKAETTASVPAPKPAVSSTPDVSGSAQKISQMVQTFGEVVPEAQNSAAPSVEVEEDAAEPFIAERTTRVAFEELMAPTRDPIGTPKPNGGFGGFAAFPDLVDMPSPGEPPATPGGPGDEDWTPTGDATAPEPESFWPPRSKPVVAEPEDIHAATESKSKEAEKSEDEAAPAATESASSNDASESTPAAQSTSLPNYPWQSVAQDVERVDEPEQPSGYYSGAPPEPLGPDAANGVEPGLVPTSRDESSASAEPSFGEPVHASSEEFTSRQSDAVPSAPANAGAGDRHEDPFAIPADDEVEPVVTETPRSSAELFAHDSSISASSTSPEPDKSESPASAAEAMNAIGREVKELAHNESGLSQEEIVARVASRVIEKMQPQVLEMVTREVLKPIVEAMVRREIESS